MGLFDIITGKRKLEKPAPDRLFAMSTADVKLESELGFRTKGVAAIVFQALDTADFNGIAKEAEEILRLTGQESGTTIEATEDTYGYRWMVLKDEDLEDLVVGINAVGGELQTGGYGDRILCAVFAFGDERGRPLYWIYNYKRGAFYPFVPAGGGQQRDNERELRIKAQIGTDLPIEPELERWFPLWGIPI